MSENIEMSEIIPKTSPQTTNNHSQIDQIESQTDSIYSNKWNISKKITKITEITEFTEKRDRLQRALRYNFLSYGDKWKVNHKQQGKLIYQFVKAIFVIIQLYCISIDINKPKNDADTDMVILLICKKFL